MTRYLSSVPIGIAVTFALLFAMQALIESGEPVVVEDPPPTIGLDFVRFKPEEKVHRNEPETKRIDPPEPLPEMPEFESSDPTAGVGVVIKGTAPKGLPTGGIDFSPYSDGPLVSIVRVAPSYPGHLLGVEGYVVVRFDVTAEGFVTNVRVVDSSHRGFERNAVRAAEKFRYKPRVVDGVAVATTNVGYRFRFELEE